MLRYTSFSIKIVRDSYLFTRKTNLLRISVNVCRAALACGRKMCVTFTIAHKQTCAVEYNFVLTDKYVLWKVLSSAEQSLHMCVMGAIFKHFHQGENLGSKSLHTGWPKQVSNQQTRFYTPEINYNWKYLIIIWIDQYLNFLRNFISWKSDIPKWKYSLFCQMRLFHQCTNWGKHFL